MSLRSGRRSGRAAVAGLLVTALALAASACLGDDGDFLGESSPIPFFQTTPQATISPGPTGTPIVTTTGTPSATTTPQATATPEPAPSADVTPVTPFEIGVMEAVNIREAPSTNADVLGAIYPGDTKRVTGEARGEEAEPGKGDLWYSLESGGFVYAPLTEKV